MQTRPDRGDNDLVTLSTSLFASLCVARERLRECDDDSAPMVAEIARLAGLSTFRFIRLFHAVFGITPHQYRIDARLERARELLITTDRPVTDVCLDVGFTSLGSFSSLFARRVGVPPSAFRQRTRPMIVVPGTLPPTLAPGCLTLMAAAFAISEKRGVAASATIGSCASS
jgi:AraC-like DNA-binding protein